MTSTVPGSHAELAAAFEQEATRLFGECSVPGVALGLLTPGGDISVNLGVTSLENPLPITSDTLFQIGSVTKTLTSLTCSALVAQGKLDLNAPVRTYLPEFRLQDESVAARLTTLDLLTHQGGFQGDLFVDTGDGDDALTRMLDRLAEAPQVLPLRGHWSYNNSGFSVVGRVIEVLTGKTYEAAVTALVLAPLGMNHTLFFPNQIMTHRFAAGHNEVGAEVRVQRPWMMERSGAPSGSSCSSTVSDLLKYAHYLLSGTVPPAVRAAPAANDQAAVPPAPEPSVLDGLDRAHLWAPLRTTGSGVGTFPGMEGQIGQSWLLDQHPAALIAGHGGATPGQQSLFWFSPDRQTGFIALTNANNGAALSRRISDWVKRELLGLVRPEYEEVQLDEGRLLAYSGTYEIAGEPKKIVAEVQDGRLVLLFPDDDAVDGVMRFPLRFFSPAHATGTGDASGLSAEFLARGEQVEFLRLYSRLYPRESTEAASATAPANAN